MVWGSQKSDFREIKPPILQVAAGRHHMLALNSDGTVTAWGDNGYGQAEVPPGLSNVVSIAAGLVHSVALRQDGTVVAWGSDHRGQTAVPEDIGPVKAIGASGLHTVLLKQSGEVVVIGGAINNLVIRVPAAAKSGVAAISVGGDHIAALKVDHSVVAWNRSGYAIPTPSGLGKVTAIYSGAQEIVAVNENGQARGWNATASLGLIGNVSSVSMGEGHGVLLRNNGTVHAWGSNSHGQASVPEGLTGVVSVSAGFDHCAALKSDGTVVFWGRSDEGWTRMPAGLDDVTWLETAGTQTLVVKADGSVNGWGRPRTRVPMPLADIKSVPSASSTAEYSNPPIYESMVRATNSCSLILLRDGTWVAQGHDDTTWTWRPPPEIGPVESLSRPGSHCLALKPDGTVTAWGYNYVGERTVPANLRNVQSVAVGYQLSMALKKDGTIAAWGGNHAGLRQVPAGLNDVVAMTPGMALRANGTVVTWGDASLGPLRVPSGLGNVIAIASGLGHMLALRQDGTVAAWGNNEHGQTDVPGELNDVAAVAAGQGHSVALKKDGTVVAWGLNDRGQTDVPPGLGGVAAIAAGGRQTVAVFGSSITLSAPRYFVQQGEQQAVVTVARGTGMSPLTVMLETQDGSPSSVPSAKVAVAGADYEATSVTVHLDEGEMTKEVVIPLIPRAGTQPNRVFKVVLKEPGRGVFLGALPSAEVRILAGDDKPPVVRLNSPGKNISALSPVPVRVTAGDANGLDRVEVSLNDGAPILAMPGAAKSVMSVPFEAWVEPVQGTNTLRVTAYDLQGNSTSITGSFTFERRFRLGLVRVPLDGISTPASAGSVEMKTFPAKGAKPLVKDGDAQVTEVLPGTRVTLTAAAKPGQMFSGWHGLPEGAVVRATTAEFIMPEADMPSVEAAFIANPYAKLGEYSHLGRNTSFRGLLTPTAGDTRGLLSVTVSGDQARLSGKLWISGKIISFTGILLGDYKVWFKTPQGLSDQLPLGEGLVLELGWFGELYPVLKTLEGTRIAEAVAWPSAYSAANPVRESLLGPKRRPGYYTMSLEASGTPSLGWGWAGVTLKSNGTLTLAGTLPEGSKFTASSFLLQSDDGPFFVQLPTPGAKPRQEGSLSGSLYFDESRSDTDVRGSEVVWVLPPAQTKPETPQPYRQGWPEGREVTFEGALYDASRTVQQTLGLESYGNSAYANLNTSIGGRLQSLTYTTFILRGNSIVRVAESPGPWALKFTPRTGRFTGTFVPEWPSPARKLPAFSGILRQKGRFNFGMGFFLSNQQGDLEPESGRAELGPN